MPGSHILRNLLLCMGIIGLGASPCVQQKTVAGPAFFPGSNANPSLKIVKERVISYILGGSGSGTYREKAIQENDRRVEAILKKRQSITWDTSEALRMNNRLNNLAVDLKLLSIAFRSKGSRYQLSNDVKKYITGGMNDILNYWNPSTPRPGNWHPWLIELPTNLGAAGLLMEPYLSPELLERLRITLRDELTERLVLTGTNAAWEARTHIYLALLDNDINRLQRAAEYVFRTVRYGTEQGVREDYCFLFHGNIPYAGSYGAGFAQTVSEFIYVFDKTPYAIDPIYQEIITTLLLEHTQWFLAAGQIDMLVRGRGYKSKGNWSAVLESLLVLAQTSDPRKNEMYGIATKMLSAFPGIHLSLTSAGFADGLKQTSGEMSIGFRYWPTGEIGAYNQPSFHIGFRQYSDRVQDYEYLNRADGGEGEEGWNLAYGFTNIIRKDGKGSWYSKDKQRNGAMLPGIDMEHLPGTTSRIGANPTNPKFQYDASKPTMSTTGYSLNFGKSKLAGGAGWKNGGVAGFLLEPAYGGFTAKKSLHFFPGGFWALGSGIRSTAVVGELSKKPVQTTILQWVCGNDKPTLVLPAGSMQTLPDSTMTLRNINWFWIVGENVAVVFNEPATVFIRLKDNILTSWLDHGSNPLDSGYAYAVLPDVSLKEASLFAEETPFVPVRNDGKVHAVKEVNGKTESLVFFEPDTCLGKQTQSPAIVYWKGDSNGGIYTIQDPLHRNDTLVLNIAGLSGSLYWPNADVQAANTKINPSIVKIPSLLGRVYRFGYGSSKSSAVKQPGKELSLSDYSDFRVEAESDAERTILTVRFPEGTIQEGYRLSVHFPKSQRLYDFTEADIIDRPSPNTIRYLWKRPEVTGPSVFNDYWKIKHGEFHVYFVARLIQVTRSFKVPLFKE